ncbi:RHS repeat-associated core domain-containing protein [Pyxidicoccus sp. 3LG]
MSDTIFMSKDGQTSRRRHSAWALAVLVLTALGVAVAQTEDDRLADEEVQSEVEKATANPIPPVGGPRTAGAAGEVSLGSLRPNYSHTDVTVKGVMGPVSFVRRYGMDTLDEQSDLNKRPQWAPFGTMKADALGHYRHAAPLQCGIATDPDEKNDCNGGLRWRHNFDSWVVFDEKRIPCQPGDIVCQSNPVYKVTWNVRDPEGRDLTFSACYLARPGGEPPLGSCLARSHESSDVKLEFRQGDVYVLHTPSGRYVYAEPLNRLEPQEEFPDPGRVSRRLSHILTADRSDVSCPGSDWTNPCQRRVATLHYGPVCVEDWNQVIRSGDTYVTSIEVAGGSTLWLDYGAIHLRDRRQLVNILADGGTDGAYVYPKECVLKKLWLTGPGEAGPPIGDVPVASYFYMEGPFEQDTGTTTERLGGLLEEVVLSAGGPQGGVSGTETRLRYEYVEPELYSDGGTSAQPLRTFRVLRNGVFERELVMDSAGGAYVKQTQVGDTKVSLWADNNYNPDAGVSYCHPGRFGASRASSICLREQMQHQQAEATTVGDGSGVLVPGVQQDALMAVGARSPHGAFLTSVGTQCTGVTCSALAPLQRTREWAVHKMRPCEQSSCEPDRYDYDAFATRSVRDTRGSLVLYENQLSLDGVPALDGGIPSLLPPVEARSVRAGASLLDGSDALLTRSFSYTYGPTYKQLVKDESGNSALVPSGSYQVRRHYDYGRLAAVVQSGYTLQFDAASNSWAPVLRHVGTFYRRGYSCSVEGGIAREGERDVKGRVVEVAGPCPVDGPDAQQCAWGQTPVPLTQYEYWPETAAPRLAGRLAVRRVFSRTSGNGTCYTPGLPVDPGTYVETRYEDYDAHGHLTRVLDANGVETKYTYSGDKLVEARVADGTPLVAVTQYGYDNGQGTGNWVHHPDGRYEVQCFRKGTTAGFGCSGGVLTDKLQWKATSRGPDGAIYSERADYVYAANGQLVGETIRDGTGAVRRQRYFEGDPLGRTTYEAMGSAAPGASSDSRYHHVSLFDMEGNRVGLGTAYQPTSSPLDPLCGGFDPQSSQAHALPASPLCKAFEYDRLNRLSRLMEPMDTQGNEVAVTCLAYDTRGNLASVVRAGAGRTCDPAAQGVVRYVHDDFGKLVRVLAPWARGAGGLAGEYHYGYDTAGNLTIKQTPAMAQASPATWVQYSYDAMARPLKAQAVRADTPTSPETLYSYGYDGQVPAPNFCPGGPGNSEGPPHLKGRVQVLTDSFGDTWYAYDVHGRPRVHWRVRASQGQAERTRECIRQTGFDSPNRRFFFDAAGRLRNEELPGGRILDYVFHGIDSAMPHRVAEVRAATWNGTQWGSEIITLLKDAQWEPYGGLKSYALQAHLSTGAGTTPWRYVDYLRTAAATVPLSRCNDTGIVAGSDFTGRLKAVTVSTEAERGAGRPGDIFKRVYTWKADQVVREDTCVLETRDVAPETLQYAGPQEEAGYDTRGQLRHVSGQPHDLRTYTYDDLGNRLRERRGDFVFQLGYSPEAGGLRADALRTRSAHACVAGDTACTNTTPLGGPTEGYAYDDDGRLSHKAWTGQATGEMGLGQLTFGATLDGPHAALGAVYRSVSDDAGRTWEYFYDAVGRRRLKQHSCGASEEYFYDGTVLLEDWSVTSLVSAEADSVRDEYIWLDGRPVAIFKTRVSRTGGRLPDFTGTCERFSDDVKPACGLYFPISDGLGKPVVMLDGAGRVTGVAAYDAFGHINRVSHLAESHHPSVLDGQHAVLATTTALPAATTGLQVHVRARFSVLRGGPGSEAYLTNGQDARLPAVTQGGPTGVDGEAGLQVATPWADASGVPQVRVHYTEAYDPHSEPEGAPWGASLEGFEYRRFQTGATPVWLPLRLPGQYHDAETDLFENWNRYYDPSIGRYLGADPYGLDSARVLGQVEVAASVNPYVYANGNPILYGDRTGNIAGVDDATLALAGAAAFAGYAAICTAMDNCPWKNSGTALSYAKDKFDALFNEDSSSDEDGWELEDEATVGQSIVEHSQFGHLEDWEDLGLESPDEIADFIDKVVLEAKGKNVKQLERGRTAYFEPDSEVVVISDPKSGHGGTAFRPRNPQTHELNGKRYFDGLR